MNPVHMPDASVQTFEITEEKSMTMIAKTETLMRKSPIVSRGCLRINRHAASKAPIALLRSSTTARTLA